MRKPARILIAGLASLMAVAGFVAVGYSFIYHPVPNVPQTASVAPAGAAVSGQQPSASESATAVASSIISSLLDEDGHGDD